MSSIAGLANILAMIAAFFGGPLFWQHTITFVRDLTYQTYGADLLGIVSLAWYGLSYMLVFFVARMSVGTALVMGGAAFVARFMV
jgi:hypothetical protein